MAREKTLAKKERGELELLEPWDTFRDMEQMMRNFFMTPLPVIGQPRRWMRGLASEYTPEVDLRETDKEFILSATVPGLTKDDLDIDVRKDSITISGERKLEEDRPGEQFHVRQQTYGLFRLSYALPSDVKPEEVKAVYKHGILEVTMPKSEVTEAHKVRIEAEETGS